MTESDDPHCRLAIQKTPRRAAFVVAVISPSGLTANTDIYNVSDPTMRYSARTSALLLFVILIAGGCRLASAPNVATDRESMPKIDIHTHYTHVRDYLRPVLDEWNMRAVIVEVIPENERTRWDTMVAHQRELPEHMILCTSFEASGFEEPRFAENVIGRLKRDIEEGARMVKVWKNVGLVFRETDGDFVQIDDPRFQPIWDFLVEEDIPVLAHIGEPRAAWLPLDEAGPHYDYYANHPQYHAYNLTDVPEWETIIDARDRWIANNPDLTIIGAHLGSLAYDTDEVAARLDRFPNLYVEPAERFGDLAIQSSEKVRDFFIEYQDRILYGTDLGTGRASDELSEAELLEEKEELIERRLQVTWDYLATGDSLEFVRTGTPFRTMTKGLNLPAEVLEKVYYRNAARLLDLDGEEQPEA